MAPSAPESNESLLQRVVLAYDESLSHMLNIDEDGTLAVACDT